MAATNQCETWARVLILSQSKNRQAAHRYQTLIGYRLPFEMHKWTWIWNAIHAIELTVKCTHCITFTCETYGVWEHFFSFSQVDWACITLNMITISDRGNCILFLMIGDFRLLILHSSSVFLIRSIDERLPWTFCAQKKNLNHLDASSCGLFRTARRGGLTSMQHQRRIQFI